MTSSTSSSATREIPFGRPSIDASDRRAVAEALESPILAHGPQGAAFEEEFAAFLGGNASCVTVSSCAAALHLAYAHFDVGPGDEVVIPAQTHAATANTAEWCGATSVFVDCDPATGNVTADGIWAAMTPRTKAITVVHFVGIPCEMPAIAQLAREHGVALIEDCALAVGARLDGTHVGLFGDAGCFSFYPVKHLTTGEGGMFVSRRADVAASVAKLRAHGVDRPHERRARPGMYDVPAIGLNYRLSELQSALGRSQLRRIDDFLARRRENFATLSAALHDVAAARVLDGSGSSWYCLDLVLDQSLAGKRDAIVDALRDAGIGTSVYYPHPVPRLEHYRVKYGYDRARFPNAEAISDRGIALPVGPHLGADDIRFVADGVRRAIEEAGA